MRLLILGGTVFLGRHLVEAALARGDEVTIFTRGESNPDLYPQVERLRGARDGDLSALAGRTWDAVVDTSGYLPRLVRASAELLAGAVGVYAFISSVSVYAGFDTPGQDETAPVGTLADPAVEVVDGDTYGPLKALCEREVERAAPGRALLIRPGLIVGPHDPTDRFTYWPRRVAQGGDTLAPGRPDLPVQFIDARDLAEWTLRMVEARRTGVYNATGPASPLTMGSLLDACKTVSGSDARFVWVPEQFLLDFGLGPWMEVPLWVPGDEMAGFLRVSVARALDAGLTFRPLAETVRATLAWDASRPPDAEQQATFGALRSAAKAGLAPEREAAALAAWRERA